MKEYEREVYADFQKFANVVETWPIYDSVVICGQMFGSEANVQGWYTTFAAFGAREQHSFFKNRTSATAGEWYCNQKTSDVMDFAYKIHSIGVEITGPPVGEIEVIEPDGAGATLADWIAPRWWAADFPWHCGIQLKVQQDIRLELPCMAASPGYGAIGGGVAFDQTHAVAPAFGQIAYMASQTVQGVPTLENRYVFPEPIGVPRTGSIEAILHVMQPARHTLTNMFGPNMFYMNSADGAPAYQAAVTRYVIRVSLFGERLVQQRAQYHR